MLLQLLLTVVGSGDGPMRGPGELEPAAECALMMAAGCRCTCSHHRLQISRLTQPRPGDGDEGGHGNFSRAFTHACCPAMPDILVCAGGNKRKIRRRRLSLNL